MVEWNGIFRLFRFFGILGQPREVLPKFRNEIPENVCSTRSFPNPEFPEFLVEWRPLYDRPPHVGARANFHHLNNSGTSTQISANLWYFAEQRNIFLLSHCGRMNIWLKIAEIFKWRSKQNAKKKRFELEPEVLVETQSEVFPKRIRRRIPTRYHISHVRYIQQENFRGKSLA